LKPENGKTRGFSGADDRKLPGHRHELHRRVGWQHDATGRPNGFGPWNGSPAFALLSVLFWLAIMSVLYRKKIFVKI
jgi:hypothetical protein